MMRLKKFEVRNYKNFKDTFTMDFSKVKNYTFNQSCIRDGLIKNAVIYGENGIGKSNFGRAILDITNHLVDKRKDVYATFSYPNADSGVKQVWFRYTLTDSDDEIVYEYEKETVNKILSEVLCVNGEKVFSCDYTKDNQDFTNLGKFGLDTLNWQFRDKSISVLRYMANNLSLPSNHFIMKLMDFVNRMLWFCSLGTQNDYIGFLAISESMSDYLIRNGYVGSFETFLQAHGVNEHLEPLPELNGQKGLYFKHEKAYLPFSVASNGTHSLLTFYYWYTQMKNASFIFIDEFDACYHFELAEQIINLAKDEMDMQVIFTSHNTNLLSNRFLRPDCCFVLTKEMLESFVDATDRELKEGHDLEMLYMSGEFNG